MNNHQFTWLLIADSCKAKIYAVHKAKLFIDSDPKNLELIGCYLHDESRLKEHDLIADKMGGFGAGTFVETTPPKAHEAEQFALQLLKQLEQGRNANHFKDVIIVAPAHFIGILHKHMHHEMKKLISQTIEKDFTLQSDKELVKSLLQYL